MGLPGGFHPNPNLSQFLGCAIIDLISIWNYFTTALIQGQYVIMNNLSFTGLIGQTVQVALIHDMMLVVCSSHIFLMYTIVAYIYNYILKFLITLINLFNGKKFNIMRNRVDSNNFSIQEFYLGVLIVALILFLLPTLAIFYFLAFIKQMISVLFMQTYLLTIQIILCNFPFHLLKFVMAHPFIIPNSINVQPSAT